MPTIRINKENENAFHFLTLTTYNPVKKYYVDLPEHWVSIVINRMLKKNYMLEYR